MRLNILTKKLLLSLLLVSPVLYITTCTFMSKGGTRAFEAVNVGDTRNTVISRFGTPSHIERPGVLYSRYASYQCQSPCVERLWFENRLSFGIEAWAVELDKGDRVVSKSYWMSP